MRIDDQLTDDAVLDELGRRLARTRLERNIGQSRLSGEAGIGVATLQRLEHGEPVSSATLVRVLRALGLLEALDRAVPEPLPSPLEQLQRAGRRRLRAGRPRTAADPERAEPWRWGDEGDST